MRTNIEIDDKLMKEALRATGAKTNKREAVELGLRTLLQLRAQEKARELRGKITWEGDLNADENRQVILVDSSVWIDYFRAADTPQVALLDSMLGRTRLAVGDLIAAEVLQGVRDRRREFKWVKRTFDAFAHVDLCDYALAIKASDN